MSLKIALTALLLTACASAPEVQAAAEPTSQLAPARDPARFRADLDAFVNRALNRVEAVPGLAIAVVDGDRTVVAAGYGLADVENRIPATAQTRFYIASATKSVTALAIAAIARRGELDMDAPLSSWSSDSGVPMDIAGRITLTDLLSHRSGIENSAIAYRVAFTGDWTPNLLWRLTDQTALTPDEAYGTFNYTNSGYNLATVLLEQRFHRDWRRMNDDEVLRPLGMTRTTALIDEARSEAPGVAVAYLGLEAGRPQRSYLQKVDATMHSAGGLVSTADDMALWLQAQINDGVVNGRRVLPAGLVASTHDQKATQEATFGPYVRTGYGLGWQIGRYGDDVLLHHFGNFAGSRAHVSFMPERRIGVAVLINEDAIMGDLADVVANYAYDWFAGAPNLEAAYDARLDALVATRDQRRQGLARGVASRAERPRMLSLPNDAYVGAYESPALGLMQVTKVGEALEISIGVQRAVAGNFTQPESVRVELTPLSGAPVVFELGSDGRPVALVYAGERFVRR